MENMSYEQVIEYINKIPQFVDGYGVDRCRYMLKYLGNPQDSFEIIHVAGSNGKGSTCAYIDSILRANGYKTGLFTSPHLVCERERIRINGELIGTELFIESFICIRLVEEKLIEDGLIKCFGYFDYFFGMSIVAYKKAGIDYMICETGLGGSKDSTNAIKKAAISIITTISLEHTAILGSTLEKIATDKAGIIKEDVPVVYFAFEKEAKQAIEKVAKSRKSLAIGVGKKDCTILKIGSNNIDFSIYNDYYKNDCFLINTKAIYQVYNATLALTALAVLSNQGKVSLDKISTADAVSDTTWAGRMEEIREGVYVDGAHNPEGIEAFVKSVAAGSDKPAVLLFSVVKDKNFEKMIKLLCDSNAFKHMVITVVDNDRKLQSDDIKKTFERYTDSPIDVCDNIEGAYNKALEKRLELDCELYCTGSLYLVGDIKGIESV